MFAQVPTMPGPVTAISQAKQTGNGWYTCGSAVEVGWRFNGTAFTPPLVTRPAPTVPTAAQQAGLLLAGGIQLMSTSTPALNGTYSTSATSITNVNAVATYILINNAFPGGLGTMPWYDVNGTGHTFPSIAEFKLFATAFANFVALVQLYADSNGDIGPLPSNQITIS